jgi:hypothetical protein
MSLSSTLDFHHPVRGVHFPKNRSAGRGIWYSSVLADAANNMIWTASPHGIVMGFEDGKFRAALQLPTAMTSEYNCFALTKIAGNTLCSKGGDRHIRFWKIDKVLQEFRDRQQVGTELVELLGMTGVDATRTMTKCYEAPSTQDAINLLAEMLDGFYGDAILNLKTTFTALLMFLVAR